MKASSSITISHITDGLTTHYQYAKNESNITAPSVGWSATVPTSEADRFIWRREGQALAGDTPSTWSTPICLTGSQGVPGPEGESLYTWVAYASDSSGGLISLSPEGKTYIGFAYNKEDPTPILDAGVYSWAKIEGAQGPPGSPGRGILLIRTEYTLGDSPTELEEVELSPDLVAYLPFNGTQKDYVSGLVASAVDVSVVDGPGVKKAYSFNGSTSRITVPDIGSSPKGFSIMVHVDSIPTGNEIVLVHGTSKIGLGFYNNGSLITGVCGGTNQKVAIISNFNAGQWNNIVVNYVTGGAEVFINGVETSYSSATNCWTAGGNDLTVGFRDTSSPGPFKGALADLRVYNRNLTSGDIDEILENLNKVTTAWDTTPPERDGGEYLWTRQVITYTDDSVIITEPVCVTGDKGSSGNPGAIGVNIDGTTLEVAGYDNEGFFGASTGRVYHKSTYFDLERTLYTVERDDTGYILGSASGEVSFARLVPLSDSGASRVAWIEFNSNEEIVGDVVIGEFLVENNVIVEANIVPIMDLNQFITSNFIRLLRTSPNENSMRLMAMAMGVDTIFQSIVAIEAFIRDLWVYKLQSEGFTQDSEGFPLSGFHFDGETGTAKITDLIARGVDIGGKLQSDGFRTLGVVPGITRPTYTVPSTIYKHSEMTDLITNAPELQSISGTIDGITFTKATRRNGARILLGEKGYFEKTVNAGKTEIISFLLPPTTFGVNFYIQWHIHYSGNLSLRRLAERRYFGANEFSDYLMTKREVNSGEHSGTFNLQTGTFNAFTVEGKSNALWGSVLAYSNYLKVWTSQDFTGVVLTGGTSAPYKTIPFEPNAYYLSSSKPFNIGGTTQDTGSIKKYKSGTDLYNHFSNVQSGKDIACTGKINVNGTVHTVTRLRREANRMVFYAGQEVLVQKFIEGTSQGVYTELAVTQQFVIGATEGGIETMTIRPWADALYDIGEVAKRFRSLYLSGELNAQTISALGAITAGGDISTSGKLSGATLNTGDGAFKIGQNLRTTDSPSFSRITASGVFPQIIVSGMGAGSILLDYVSATNVYPASSTYVKALEITARYSGTVTTIISGTLLSSSSGDGRLRVYKNGSAVGTVRTVSSGTSGDLFSENISVLGGDKIQLYVARRTERSADFKSVQLRILGSKSAIVEQGGYNG